MWCCIEMPIGTFWRIIALLATAAASLICFRLILRRRFWLPILTVFWIGAALRRSFIFNLHMPSRIGVSQWIICDVTIPIQALRIGIPWHNRICAQEAVNIRRIPLSLSDKITRRGQPALRPFDINQDSVLN